MNLRENPLLSRVLQAAADYRAGSLSAEELQHVLSGVMSAVESDVPKSVQDALFQAEARVDSARFTVDIDDQAEVIGEVLDDLAVALQTADADR
jgi:hypothetical protein